MTRIPLVALAALTVAACQQEQSPPAVDAVQDKTAAVVGQTSAATMGANTVMGYVPNAAMGDMYEIQAAEIERLQSVAKQQIRPAGVVRSSVPV